MFVSGCGRTFMKDEVLTELVQSDDNLAFRKLFIKCYLMLCEYVSTYVGEHDFEDLMQCLMIFGDNTNKEPPEMLVVSEKTIEYTTYCVHRLFKIYAQIFSDDFQIFFDRRHNSYSLFYQQFFLFSFRVARDQYFIITFGWF